MKKHDITSRQQSNEFFETGNLYKIPKKKKNIRFCRVRKQKKFRGGKTISSFKKINN